MPFEIDKLISNPLLYEEMYLNNEKYIVDSAHTDFFLGGFLNGILLIILIICVVFLITPNKPEDKGK